MKNLSDTVLKSSENFSEEKYRTPVLHVKHNRKTFGKTTENDRFFHKTSCFLRDNLELSSKKVFGNQLQNFARDVFKIITC